MRQTLFWIPYQAGDVPIFGVGVLLAVWVVLGIALLAWLIRRQGFNADTRSYLPLLALVGLAIAFLPKVFPEPMPEGGTGLPIRGYGVMLLLAVVLGVALAVHRARQMGVQSEIIFSLAFWMFVSGIVGARLFHVIEYWGPLYKKTTPEGNFDLGRTLLAMINVPGGGLVVYGALIAVTITLAVFFRLRRLPALAMCDLVAPSMVLGLALGRVGCLLNGCCFGGVCEQPWAVRFPPGSPPYARQAEYGLLQGVQLADQAEGLPTVRAIDPDSPAAAAGLAVGDEIRQAGGAAVAGVYDIHQRWRAMLPGSRVAVQTADGRQIVWTAPAAPASTFPVHPTQIYSAINALLLCLLLLAYYPFRRRDGEVFALMLTLYPIARFLIEIIRRDERPVFGLELSISQVVSLLFAVAVAALWTFILRQPPHTVFPKAAVEAETNAAGETSPARTTADSSPPASPNRAADRGRTRV